MNKTTHTNSRLGLEQAGDLQPSQFFNVEVDYDAKLILSENAVVSNDKELLLSENTDVDSKVDTILTATLLPCTSLASPQVSRASSSTLATKE